MSTREISIAQAAIHVYTQKGIRRTTMADVAKAANVTRQTVYNAFSNTDGVLRAAIRLFISQQWQKVCVGWEKAAGLDEKLDILFLHFAIETWEYIKLSDATADLVDGYNSVGRNEIEQAKDGFRGDIAALFEDARDTLKVRGSSPEALSDFISMSIEGIKFNSNTRADLDRGIATLKGSVLALSGLAE
ncbi:TetR/AcrR family transcriptional regulator [Octadecabacter sp. G9-8]|uniref:TetR/AcrR family transcriptional regulator n=1 Tax=Octadecabacter dasysiphoniae TaxID=2909341 RepID=A0ABS9CQH6_9RHOB|nr:TetR/AcrR family transcriptional regulator [Octadecabacter dasysiphoniae]MCF2869495.1 TetR/AcrR family transcriptional regulator [Octadecabacter dasysiphoniae]